MKLSIIIPCYNEEKDIKNKIESFAMPFLNKSGLDYELILVNDGSKDHTKEAIASIPGVVASGYDINKGKGGAVQCGINDATGDYIVFMDADLSTDMKAFTDMLPYLKEYDMVIGSRHCKGAVLPIKPPLTRRIMSKGCNFIVKTMFGLKYKDTQCGFKVIKTSLAKEMIKHQIIMKFAFDVEYLYIAKLNNIKVFEMPVTWRDDRDSTVSPIKSSLRFFKDLRVIKKNKKNYLFK